MRWPDSCVLERPPYLFTSVPVSGAVTGEGWRQEMVAAGQGRGLTLTGGPDRSLRSELEKGSCDAIDCESRCLKTHLRAQGKIQGGTRWC